MSLKSSSDLKSPQSARVVVIGSGPSGLAAGTRLVDAGFQNVLILEAENRIGGRVYTVPFGDSVVDLGAQWCHGEKDNVVYETLKRLDRLSLLEHTSDSEYNIKFVRSSKELVSDAVAEEVMDLVQNIPMEKDDFKAYDGSVGGYLTETFWRKFEKLDSKVDRALAKEMFDNWKKEQLSVDSADTLFELAASSKVNYWYCEGDNLLHWKDNGFHSILNILLHTENYQMDLGLLKDKIQFNHCVKHIEWGSKSEIKITLHNGKVIMADHVVCTVSLGVLKENHKTMFEPSLPLSKERAIDGLKLGVVNKFFFEFEKMFLPDDWRGINCLWREEDLKILRETEYFWMEGISGFYGVSYQPRILCGWIVGRHARYAETLTEDEVLKALMWMLRKFLNFPVPDPIKFIRTQWYTNNNFRGTYSYRTLYADELRTGAWDLAAAMTDDEGKPIVQFAGEATHNHYFGTVHGAIETGWREAERLINYYQVKMTKQSKSTKICRAMALVTSPVKKTFQTTRVVVIGCGCSGMAAATRLVEAGFQNVLVLETENRIGGRVHTIPFGDNVVDLGAQWCHGEEDNAIYETLKSAKRLDLLEHTDEESTSFKCVRSNKEVLTENEILKLKDIFTKMKDIEDDLHLYEGSLGSKYTDIFWSEFAKLTDKPDRVVARELFENWKKNELSGDAADTLFDVAVSDKIAFWDCEGDYMLHWKDKGFHSFFNVILKTKNYKTDMGLLDKKVQLNERVKYIEWKQGNEIKITLDSGKIIMADHVICTVSLGVLQENHEILFKPCLPLWKVRAINGLKLGIVNKFFFEFQKPFEPLNWAGFFCLWRDEEIKALRDTEKFWLESVFGFFRVKSQPRLLQGWIIGSHARYMETLSKKEVLKSLMWMFKKFLTVPVPEPIKFMRTQWYNNRNFRGTYSFRTPRTDELRTGASHLAAPLRNAEGKPIVQFAGEATNSHHFATAHGATESGWREAERLINYYQ
uniref:Amine oxidase domain-containing protein n=1 Tax=Glossina brevipalpis TaxID=37001 RepID=A0A1A9WL88_9MUSC